MDLKNKVFGWVKMSGRIIFTIAMVIGAGFFIYGFIRAAASPNYDLNSKDCEQPINSYSEGSGHYAGWEWAEKNMPATCGGNSQSFIEGCEENLKQNRDYQVCEYHKKNGNGLGDDYGGGQQYQ